tara:strand:+ start:556 stop:756 length:201 start_codon:yes stop_codon:yes gene_type:complete
MKTREIRDSIKTNGKAKSREEGVKVDSVVIFKGYQGIRKSLSLSTTNKMGLLNDSTGNRKYWIIEE